MTQKPDTMAQIETIKERLNAGKELAGWAELLLAEYDEKGWVVDNPWYFEHLRQAVKDLREIKDAE